MSPGTLAPIVYLPHGGGPRPLFDDPEHRGLIALMKGLPADLGRPDAVLLISAHWEAPLPTLTGHPAPALYYDYYNFPPEAYTLRYPAPGAPELADRVARLLGDGGFEAAIDPERGFDHGMFVPMKLIYPDADVPCIQLSLLASLDPAEHIALGRALAPLRAERIAVIGSGLSFHNLRVLGVDKERVSHESRAFDDWLVETCTDAGLDDEERARRLVDWAAAPHARYCHPREEHLLPLHVCFGMAVATTPMATLLYDAPFMGKQVCALRW